MTINWQELFMPTLPLLEIVLRGSLTYLFLLFLLRLFRRQAGTIGLSDLLVIVLIADAAQNAMASEYHSLTEGAVLVTTIAGWDFMLDWLGYRYPVIERLIRPAPLLLVRAGRLQRHNLRKEMITEEELHSQLREQGIDELHEVKKCWLEGDGKLSVIRYSQSPSANGKAKPSALGT